MQCLIGGQKSRVSDYLSFDDVIWLRRLMRQIKLQQCCARVMFVMRTSRGDLFHDTVTS